MGVIFRIILLILLTVGIIKTNIIFLKKPIFRTKKIEIISGDEGLKKTFEPLKEALIGQNIKNVNLEKIKMFILKDIRVKDVTIEKDSLNEILIKIKEKEPYCYVQYRNRIYIVDKNGELYGYSREIKKRDFICLVINEKFVSLEEQIKIFLEIVDKLNSTDFKDIVSQIYIKNYSLIEIVLSNRTILKTNRDVDIDKYSIGSCLFFDLSNKKEIQYMDLRYKDYIIKYMEDKNER